MILVFTLILSIIFQLSAAVMAIMMIRITKSRMAWSLISAALFLMMIRRIIPLYHIMTGNDLYPVDPLNEYIGLGLSFIMMMGIAGIRPLFLNIKHSEEKLMKSEKKFRNTLENMDEAYYSVTLDGILLDHNQSLNKIIGSDANVDMRGSRLPEFWQYKDERKAYVRELMTKGFIRNYIIHMKNINGEETVVMVNAHLIKDEKNNPVRIDGNVTDITELKHAEQTLEDSREFYQRLLEGAPDAIFIQTEERFAYVNSAVLRLYGATSPMQLIGRPIYERFHPAYHEMIRERVRLLHDEKAGTSIIEQRHLKMDGTILNVEVSAVPFNYLGKDGAIVFVRDISYRKDAELNIKRLNEELERKVAERTAELKEAVTQLEELNRVFVGREMKMAELKNRIAELENNNLHLPVIE